MAAQSEAPAAEVAPPSDPPAAPAAVPTAPVPAAPTNPKVVKPPPEPNAQWDNLDEELAMTAEGGIDVCEAASLPLSLIPGIGDAVGTVTEWFCLIPAAIAVDTVALQFGGRDATLWQATVALLAKKLFMDLLDTPLYIAIAVAVLAAVGVGTYAFLAGFPIFLPAVIAVGAGALLVAPVVWLRDKGGELIFSGLFALLTNQIYGAELGKKQSEALFKPGDIGWARGYVLMTAAAGTKGETGLAGIVPIAGPLWKASDEAAALKERMRRVGRDVLKDPEGSKDLSGMDATIDVVTTIKGIAGATGQGVAVIGLGVGLAGAVLPAMGQVDQQTGDTIGFTGLGIALTGFGIYALSSTMDTVKTFAVPCAYGFDAPVVEATEVKPAKPEIKPPDAKPLEAPEAPSTP